MKNTNTNPTKNQPQQNQPYNMFSSSNVRISKGADPFMQRNNKQIDLKNQNATSNNKHQQSPRFKEIDINLQLSDQIQK
jgi:hypothetical protein